ADDPRLARAARARAPHDARPGRVLGGGREKGSDPYDAECQNGTVAERGLTPPDRNRGKGLPMTTTITRIKPLADRTPARPIADGVRIGHVHLKVANLDRALSFYCDILGFELTQRRGG